MYQVGGLGGIAGVFVYRRRDMCDLLQRLWLVGDKDYGVDIRRTIGIIDKGHNISQMQVMKVRLFQCDP